MSSNGIAVDHKGKRKAINFFRAFLIPGVLVVCIATQIHSNMDDAFFGNEAMHHPLGHLIILFNVLLYIMCMSFMNVYICTKLPWWLNVGRQVPNVQQ